MFTVSFFVTSCSKVQEMKKDFLEEIDKLFYTKNENDLYEVDSVNLLK